MLIGRNSLDEKEKFWAGEQTGDMAVIFIGCFKNFVTDEWLAGALEEKEDKKEGDEEEDPEIAEAKREAEEKRNEKYRKMEEEREVMRQGIRDKVSWF